MAGILGKLGQVLYRIWFYVLVAVPILVFLPFLILSTLSQRTYGGFFWMARNLWAIPVLYGMGCPPRVVREQRMAVGQSYMLVANHRSMLDIMLMLYVARNPFVFVGKRELVKIPIFGFFYKRVSILVDRDSPKSRTGVYRRAESRLRQGLGICIFPEGGVPEEDVMLDTFKDGAFKMAIANGIPVAPMTFYDCGERLPFSLSHGGPGRLRVRTHHFIETSALNSDDMPGLRDQARELILTDLLQDHKSES